MMPSFAEIIKEAIATMRSDIRQTTLTLWIGCCLFSILSACGWKLLAYPKPLPAPHLQPADKSEVLRLQPGAMAEATYIYNVTMDKRAKK